MAGTTGLEPATSAVTGQRSNQLSYVPGLHFLQFGFMSHRMSGFLQNSLFSLCSSFGLVWTQFLALSDTKFANPTTELVYQMNGA